MIVGVILAGGRGTRLGGRDKALLPLAGRPLVAWVVDRLRPEVDALAINANGDPSRFDAFGLPVIADPLPDGVPERPGPLAGILAGMDWAAGLGADTLVTAPADAPFLPPGLVAALVAATAREGRPAAAAATPERHPLAALWPVTARDRLRADLAAGTRRVRDFADRLGCATALLPADGFLNVNTPADLAAAEARLRG